MTLFSRLMVILLLQKMRGWLCGPPAGSFVILNMDRSSLGNPKSFGFGGLFHDIHGEWLSRYSRFCSFPNNLTTELMAINR